MKFSGDAPKAMYKQSLVDKSFKANMNLFGKYHAGGIKLSDPTVSLASFCKYEWSSNSSKFEFTGLQGGDTSITARNRADGCQSVQVTKKINADMTGSFKLHADKSGNRSYAVCCATNLMGADLHAKVHPQRLLDGKSDKHDIKCSAAYKTPVDGLTVGAEVKAKFQGASFCHHNVGFTFSGVDNLKLGGRFNHKQELLCDATYNLKELGAQVGALVNVQTANQKVSWVAACQKKMDDHTVKVKVNDAMQVACEHSRSLGQGCSIAWGTVFSASDPSAALKNTGLKLSFKL